jgi:surfactin synthase thioesterase subunit
VPDTPQFVIAKPKPSAASRLFCFPHAGGGPIAFFDWPRRLGAEIECVCLQYSGRGSRLREKPCTSVDELVGQIAGGFTELADKPFAFYGHSLGGLVAFELARQMRRSGSPGGPGLQHLFVGASRAPHLPLAFAPIHQLPDMEFIGTLQKRYGGIPAAIYQEPEVMEMFMPAMRGDFTALETYEYRPGEPLDLPITAFAGAEDTAVKLESLKEWSLHTAAGFDMNVLPGGHFFQTTNAKELVGALQIRLGAHQGERNSTLAS